MSGKQEQSHNEMQSPDEPSELKRLIDMTFSQDELAKICSELAITLRRIDSVFSKADENYVVSVMKSPAEDLILKVFQAIPVLNEPSTALLWGISELFFHENIRLKQQAAYTLSTFGSCDMDTMKKALKCINDSDLFVSRYCLTCLCRGGEPAALFAPELVRDVWLLASEELRLWISHCISMIRKDCDESLKVVDFLLHYYNAHEGDDKRFAVNILGRFTNHGDYIVSHLAPQLTIVNDDEIKDALLQTIELLKTSEKS